MVVNNTTSEKIDKKIRNLKNLKSVGHDGISNENAKRCFLIIESYVANVFNKCFE